MIVLRIISKLGQYKHLKTQEKLLNSNLSYYINLSDRLHDSNFKVHIENIVSNLSILLRRCQREIEQIDILLDSLTEENRFIVKNRYIEGYSWAVIEIKYNMQFERFGICKNTVINRCKKNLRNLENCYT